MLDFEVVETISVDRMSISLTMVSDGHNTIAADVCNGQKNHLRFLYIKHSNQDLLIV